MQNHPTSARSGPLRHDWTREEIKSIHQLPLPELIFQAQVVHREFHAPEEVQLCRLLSIKTARAPKTARIVRKARTTKRAFRGRN